MRTEEATVYVTRAVKKKLQKLKRVRRNRRLIDTLEQAVDQALRSDGIDPQTLRPPASAADEPARPGR